MPSSSSLDLGLDSLLYGYVKEKNPCLLTQLFSREKCRELEKLDYLYDSKTLPTMLQKYRKIHTKPVEHNDRHGAHTSTQGSIVQRHVKPIAMKGNLYSKDMMHRRFCRVSDPQMHLNLVVFNHFYMNGDPKALELLFDEENRQKFGKMVTKIDVPSVLRLAAHRRNEKEKSKAENKSFLPISTCQLCKRNFQGTQSVLMGHIGLHEDIPQYCFVEGCDKYLKSLHNFVRHLQRNHLLFAKDFTASQYHQLQSMRNAWRRTAGRFMDKYFPAESFVGFSDKKITNAQKLEDEKCLKCGEIIKATKSRRRHVAAHINLSYECVIEGCQATTNPNDFANHLKYHHSKKISQLNARELHQSKKNNMHFNRLMKEELPKYFPRKSGADEE